MTANKLEEEIVVRLYDEVDVEQFDEFLLIPIFTVVVIIGAIMISFIIFRIFLCHARRKRIKEKAKKDVEITTETDYEAITKTKSTSAANSTKVSEPEKRSMQKIIPKSTVSVNKEKAINKVDIKKHGKNEINETEEFLDVTQISELTSERSINDKQSKLLEKTQPSMKHN